MAEIEKIRQLREETGISLGECKKALENCEGDLGRAREWLRERGAEVAAKKQERDAEEGRIFSYVHSNAKIGVLVELRCETDFVARGDDLKNLGQEMAMQVASMNPGSVEDLLGQSSIKEPGRTVRDAINDVVARVGENIVVARFERFAI